MKVCPGRLSGSCCCLVPVFVWVRDLPRFPGCLSADWLEIKHYPKLPRNQPWPSSHTHCYPPRRPYTTLSPTDLWLWPRRQLEKFLCENVFMRTSGRLYPVLTCLLFLHTPEGSDEFRILSLAPPQYLDWLHFLCGCARRCSTHHNGRCSTHHHNSTHPPLWTPPRTRFYVESLLIQPLLGCVIFYSELQHWCH
jgi:hypothetical protein